MSLSTSSRLPRNGSPAGPGIGFNAVEGIMARPLTRYRYGKQFAAVCGNNEPAHYGFFLEDSRRFL
jgi:hypothetical protein